MPGCSAGALPKVVHLLRSMEYQDEAGHPVCFGELQNVIGQFPYQSPSVFHFFAADFELPMRIMSESEPEPEMEAESRIGDRSRGASRDRRRGGDRIGSEGEAEAREKCLTRWPMQVLCWLLPNFHPSVFVLNYIRRLSNVISVGAHFPCGNSVVGNEVRYVPANGGPSAVCTVGQLRFKERATLNETVSLLDLLLTGGRMTTHTRATVVRAYKSAGEGHRLQAAQEAVGLSAEY